MCNDSNCNFLLDVILNGQEGWGSKSLIFFYLYMSESGKVKTEVLLLATNRKSYIKYLPSELTLGYT